MKRLISLPILIIPNNTCTIHCPVVKSVHYKQIYFGIMDTIITIFWNIDKTDESIFHVKVIKNIYGAVSPISKIATSFCDAT